MNPTLVTLIRTDPLSAKEREGTLVSMTAAAAKTAKTLLARNKLTMKASRPKILPGSLVTLFAHIPIAGNKAETVGRYLQKNSAPIRSGALNFSEKQGKGPDTVPIAAFVNLLSTKRNISCATPRSFPKAGSSGGWLCRGLDRHSRSTIDGFRVTQTKHFERRLP
jgi:hypothetical protein